MRILIAGLGGIGQRHARNLRALLGDQVELLAYRTRRLNRLLTDRLQVDPAGDVERSHGIRAHTDLNAALAERPDAVFVCNPSSLHMEVAQAAADQGCHLFIEKPVSHSYDGIDELLAKVRQQKLVTLVGYQLRFHPCLQRLHQLLSHGAIGRIIAVRAEVGEHLPSWHTYEDYRGMYASRRALGGGVILSQIHELDYLYWFFGIPHRVFALGGHLSRLEVDVEDTASILMECSADGRQFPVHVHEDYLQRPPSRTCQVIGDEGKLLLDLHEQSLRHYDGDGRLAEEIVLRDFNRNDMFLAEIRHFLACVEGKEEPLASLYDGAQSLRMALAARESLESGRVVELGQ